MTAEFAGKQAVRNLADGLQASEFACNLIELSQALFSCPTVRKFSLKISAKTTGLRRRNGTASVRLNLKDSRALVGQINSQKVQKTESSKIALKFKRSGFFFSGAPRRLFNYNTIGRLLRVK